MLCRDENERKVFLGGMQTAVIISELLSGKHFNLAVMTERCEESSLRGKHDKNWTWSTCFHLRGLVMTLQPPREQQEGSVKIWPCRRK